MSEQTVYLIEFKIREFNYNMDLLVLETKHSKQHNYNVCAENVTQAVHRFSEHITRTLENKIDIIEIDVCAVRINTTQTNSFRLKGVVEPRVFVGGTTGTAIFGNLAYLLTLEEITSKNCIGK